MNGSSNMAPSGVDAMDWNPEVHQVEKDSLKSDLQGAKRAHAALEGVEKKLVLQEPEKEPEPQQSETTGG